MAGKHHLRLGADITRYLVNDELAYRWARKALDPEYSPWDSPVIGRHRANGKPTVAHPGLVPDWEELVSAPPF